MNDEQMLRDFLKEHPAPKVVVASTVYDGYVSCIKPIPTICGAEVVCSAATADEVRQIIRNA